MAMKGNRMGNWFDNFGELNLHCKIVGDRCIKWSRDHQIVVGTSRKIFMCDLSTLIGGKKAEEVGFIVGNVPISEDQHDYDVGINEYLSSFETACTKSSNVIASPDYDIYKVFLDPTLYGEKQKSYSGVKALAFSPSGFGSVSRGELLAVLTLDHSLVIYRQVSDGCGIRSKWEVCANVSEMLQKYLESKDGSYPEFPIDSELSRFEILREKKYSASMICFAWSNIYKSGATSVCFLATCTKNGFTVVWRFSISPLMEVNVDIVDVLRCDWPEIASVAWLQNSNAGESHFLIGLAVSCHNGQITCQIGKTSIKGEISWTGLPRRTIWEERDRLKSRQIHWINDDCGSLFITSKSHILMAMKLDKQLEIVEESVLQDVHSMPIVNFCLHKENETHHIYTCSSDGMIAHINVTMTPKLNLQHLRTILDAKDIGSFNGFSPTMLHGISLSPNQAFVAMLTSQPKVKLSIQVDNVASLSLKRLLSPSQAAQRLLEATVLNNNDKTLYKHLDLIEIIREHYALTQTFDPLLVEFLSETNFAREKNLQKLQLRWHLINLKDKITNIRRRTTAAECMMRVVTPSSDQCKLIQEILTVRQMTKALSVWSQNISFATKLELERIPVIQLVNILESKMEFLLPEDIAMINKIKMSPSYQQLPVQPTCNITSLPLDLSIDGRCFVTSDGSSWPACCLSFSVLQGYQKRKCRLSGLYAAVINEDNPRWVNELLSSACIFSGAPLT